MVSYYLIVCRFWWGRVPYSLGLPPLSVAWPCWTIHGCYGSAIHGNYLQTGIEFVYKRCLRMLFITLVAPLLVISPLPFPFVIPRRL